MTTLDESNGRYPVSDNHILYWERYGTPEGEPIFFLHGGPGGYCNKHHLRFFDLEHFNVVLFDQRGCGSSTPQGLLTDNCTDLLVNDIEALRVYFGFLRISLLGVSWGSWLALKYQHHYSHRVFRCVAASVFVPTCDVLDLYNQTLQHNFDCLSDAGLCPQQTYNTLCTGSPTEQRQVALAWSKAHLPTSMTPEQLNTFVDACAIASIRLELHYHLNQYFFSPNDLNLHINPSTTLIQGLDDECGMHSFRWLQQRTAGICKLVQAGHNAFEPTLLNTIRDTLSPPVNR